MHEREKSDPAIRAGKPTNKAEANAHAEHGVSDAAELVEQRAGAKGNANEHSTHRTQGRERVATGDMIIVRYADDIVVGFEHEADARRFWEAMRKRLEEFSLSLHPEKTRTD